MSFRFNMMLFGSFILVVLGAVLATDRFCSAQLLVNGTVNTVEGTEQPAEVQKQPLMTPALDQASVKFDVDQLHLNMYQAAAAGDLSLCADDEVCLKHAKGIRGWICAAAVCDGTDTSKKPTDCFDGLSESYSPEAQEQINASICPVMKTPDIETRRNFLIHAPDFSENELVRYGAYLFALKGSAVSCENYIKKYVGAYGGPQWNYQWYRALSGCRILAQESTREQEEEDFYRWLGVLREVGDPCSDIVNSELRNACSTPGAKLFSPDDQ